MPVVELQCLTVVQERRILVFKTLASHKIKSKTIVSNAHDVNDAHDDDDGRDAPNVDRADSCQSQPRNRETTQYLKKEISQLVSSIVRPVN